MSKKTREGAFSPAFALANDGMLFVLLAPYITDVYASVWSGSEKLERNP